MYVWFKNRELITKGKLATVMRFDNEAFSLVITLVITRSYRKREQEFNF